MDRQMEKFTNLSEVGVDNGVTNGCVDSFDWGNGGMCKHWWSLLWQQLQARVMGSGRQLPLLIDLEVKHCSTVPCNGSSTKMSRYPASLEKECGLVHLCDAHMLVYPHHHLCVWMLKFGSKCACELLLRSLCFPSRHPFS